MLALKNEEALRRFTLMWLTRKVRMWDKMDYSIIGFPRIGAHRELKFATEKYFRGEISAEELKNTVVAQREAQWKLQNLSKKTFLQILKTALNAQKPKKLRFLQTKKAKLPVL